MQPRGSLKGRILIALATILGIIFHSFERAPNASIFCKKPITLDSKPIFREISQEIFNFARSLLFAVAEEIESGLFLPPDQRITRQKAWRLSEDWEEVFGAPASEIMAIVEIESGWYPRKRNMLRSEKGGAWGLGGQMLDEACGKIRAIRHELGKNPRVVRALKKWNGSGTSLLNPELNLMLTSWQIAQIRRRLEDLDQVSFAEVAAAYHQGTNVVIYRIQRGRPLVSPQRHPRGHIYVQRALGAFAAFQNASTMPL
jgi:hypothetical protein